MKKLPPLNALRTFESAARHLSFSKAASELNVTPGAISQQIKTLEQQLDTRLFERLNRQILLTDSGQLLLPQLTESFRLMSEAVETVEKQQHDEPLNITAPPSFVSKWLIPRLHLFNKKHPEINVRIDASTRLVDFERENIDIGIRFSQHENPDLVSSHLMSLKIIPVCSPALLEENPAIGNPSNLNQSTLLHYENSQAELTWPDWNMWLATVGIEGINTSRGIIFNQTDLMIQAALEGQGLALIATVYANNDIENGKLVQPFGQSMPIEFSYYLVSSPYKSRREKVRLFKQWMIEQSASRADRLGTGEFQT